jgi:hypothetical protein
MLNLKLYISLNLGHAQQSKDVMLNLTPELLQSQVNETFVLAFSVNDVPIFKDWVLLARHRNDRRHVSFYSKDSSPEHKRHAFGSDYARAYRFSKDNLSDVLKILKDLNEAPPRNVGDCRYPISALSEAFGLPLEELTDENVYFQLVDTTIVLS